MRSILLLAVVGGCTVRDHYSYPPDASGDATTNGDGGGGDAVAADAVVADADPAQASFDIAFVNDWTILDAQSTETLVDWVRIVNTGASPLDLSTAVIVAATDSDPSAFDVNVTWGGGADFELSPGMSAGQLSTRAANHVAGLVTEPEQLSVGVMQVEIDDFAPSGWTTLVVDISVQIEDAVAMMTVTIQAGFFDPTPIANSGIRIASTAL